MKTIYKYDLDTTDIQTVNLPTTHEILCIQTQHGKPTLWAKVDTNCSSTVNVNIYTFGTGHNIPDIELFYLGTYQLNNGSLIFHIFTDEPIK